MKITRFPSNPGPAAWDAILPKPASFGALEADESTDWLIIGAGFAGLAAARRLSQICPTDKITVIDALRVGEGPAGRNTGFMIDLPHDLASSDYGGDLSTDRATIERNRAAISFADEMVQELGIPDEAFRKVGKINGAASAKGMQHNAEYAAHLQNLNEPSEMLDAHQMREITGSNYYHGGLFTPGTVVLQPALFVRSIAEKLRSNRIKIYEQSKVISLMRTRTEWHAQTPKRQDQSAQSDPRGQRSRAKLWPLQTPPCACLHIRFHDQSAGPANAQRRSQLGHHACRPFGQHNAPDHHQKRRAHHHPQSLHL